MLKTNRLLLRALRGEDLPELIALHNDAGVKTMAAMHQFPVSPESEKAWLEGIIADKSNTKVYFGIENLISGKLAGICFLQNINWVDRVAWFGIAMLPDCQGMGFGKDALDLIVQYGFEALNLMKISLNVLAINVAALKMYEIKGFVKEGVLKSHCNVQGKRCDLIIMSLFRDGE